MKEYFANGRKIRHDITINAVEFLFERVDALKNGRNEKYSAEEISKIKSEWTGFRRFLNLSAATALDKIEGEFDLIFHSGIIKLENGLQEISIYTKNGVVQRVEF